MSVMSTEILPIDVIDHILSFLRSDIDTLKTCAKSHPILSDLSERYIYANVVLRDDIYDIHVATDLRTSEFTQILAEKSDIANHVRTLEVVCVFGDPGTEQHNMTFSHLHGVASLLPILAGLIKFKIRGSLNNDECFPWHAVPETFCQAFQNHLHPQDIVIDHIAFFPMSLCNNCRNVRLSLDYCRSTQYDGKSTDSEKNTLRSYPMPLDRISIKDLSSMCLENIAAWIKLHGLRSLNSSITEFTDSFRQLLVACSNSLTNLYLDTSECHVDTSYQISDDSTIRITRIGHFPFTLADLRHLTQLTMVTNTPCMYGPRASLTMLSPIPGIAELISTGSPTLKDLSIKIVFYFIGSHFELPDPNAIWSPFISLAARCSSASISMYISPSFVLCSPRKKVSPNFLSPLTDYKGLTPYMQSGVVVISEGYLSPI